MLLWICNIIIVLLKLKSMDNSRNLFLPNPLHIFGFVSTSVQTNPLPISDQKRFYTNTEERSENQNVFCNVESICLKGYH